MIEVPDVPTVGGMTSRAGRTEAALVLILQPVTAQAVALGFLVSTSDVARFARNDRMEPKQRKVGEVVIEMHIGAPALLHVALVALRTELTAMHVPGEMAAVAICGKLLLLHHSCVAGMAIKLLVRAQERKVRIARVIEASGLPRLRCMTAFALRAEAAAMRVIGLVA